MTDPMGPWQKIPDVYKPNMKEHYFPHQLELAVGVNEKEIREFAKYIGADSNGTVTSLIHAIRRHCTKNCAMPRHVPTIEYRLLADPDARYGFSIMCSYDIADLKPKDFNKAFYDLQKLWQDAGINKKTMWHLSAINSRCNEAKRVSLSTSYQSLILNYPQSISENQTIDASS